MRTIAPPDYTLVTVTVRSLTDFAADLKTDAGVGGIVPVKHVHPEDQPLLVVGTEATLRIKTATYRKALLP
jgi:hypothetical protein